MMAPGVVARQSGTDSNSENVLHLFLQNHHLSLQMTADVLDISKNIVRNTITENLRTRKVCLRFLLHTLTAEQEKNRSAACQDLR